MNTENRRSHNHSRNHSRNRNRIHNHSEKPSHNHDQNRNSPAIRRRAPRTMRGVQHDQRVQ